MALEFDIRKYNPEDNTLIDGSDALANQRDQVISFQNIRNQESVFFKAFITAFSDTYSPNFNSVEVFGRTDPIQQYKGTSRSITLAFKVPAASESEAFENLGRAGKLIQMLYPSYASVSNALTLSEAPLVRLKVMNLLSKIDHESARIESFFSLSNSLTDFYSDYKSTAAPDKGVLGVITSCTVNHGLESEGAFSKIDETGEEPTGVPNTILPKLIEINVSFAPIHEDTIGFVGDQSEFNNAPSFPYGVSLRKNTTEGNIPTVVSSNQAEQEKTLEELRQAAASAQQAEDLAKAQLDKTKSKMGRSRKGGSRNRKLSERALGEQQTFEELEQASDSAQSQYDALATEMGYL
tara:strand:- start:2280 stop:3332 length:1053 start_codon:yes stop_codon:yes gene_type:complete